MVTRQILTVRLKTTDDGLQRSFLVPEYGHLQQYDSQSPWADIEDGLVLDGQPGLTGLAALLDSGGEKVLTEHLMGRSLVDVGELLFRVLLGRREQWLPLLRAVFRVPEGDPDPEPSFSSLRVRVLSEDPLLATLPWRLTAWKGRWLLDALPAPASGWTFEAVTHEKAQGTVDLPGPCKILVIAPQCIAADTEQHLEAIRQVLADISEQYRDETHLLLAEDRADLIEGLHGMRPQIVYYYGHGGVVRGQPCLLLGKASETPDALSMADLRSLLAPYPPRMVFLNACKLGAGGWQAAGQQLVPPVSFVVANRTSAFTLHATQLATSFFHRCLGEGRDPIVALHHLPKAVSTSDFQWATVTAWTNYQHWRTGVEPGPRLHRQAGLRLDRDAQRALARKHVDELTASPNRKVEALITYGSEGSLVEHFGDQLSDYLRHHKVRITWKSRDPHDPNPMVFEPDHLEEDLGIWLQTRRKNLHHALGLQVPSRGTIHVLGLDWGVFGPRHRPAPSHEEIAAWLCFCADVLALRCPEDLRILCHLSLELPVEEHGEREEHIELLADGHDTEAFRCTLLPALADVKKRDIRNYLADRANTNCSPVLATEVSGRIFDRTQGRYEETVALIKEGEKGWNQFLRKLRKESP